MADTDGRQNTYRIVLYQPEIPANTGNIGRLCLGANAELHLIKPFRFFLNDKYLQRAGLDYWERVKLFIHDDWESFVRWSVFGVRCLEDDTIAQVLEDETKTTTLTTPNTEHQIYLCSTKGKILYTEPTYHHGDYFVFGPESRGLPENLLSAHTVITIPQTKEIRSINLCNSVSIILYEALRQIEFAF